MIILIIILIILYTNLLQLDRLKLAASASYTYYLRNPEDEDVRRNIAFYRDRAKVRESDFLDLELRPYKVSYRRAVPLHKVTNNSILDYFWPHPAYNKENTTKPTPTTVQGQ